MAMVSVASMSCCPIAARYAAVRKASTPPPHRPSRWLVVGAADVGDRLEHLNGARHVVVEPDVGVAGVGIDPGRHENAAAAVQLGADDRLLGLEVNQVVLVHR